MDIEPERVAEALHEADGAAPGLPLRCRNTRPSADRGKDGAHKYLRESVIFFSDELPLEGLPPGTYTLEVTETDHSRAS